MATLAWTVGSLYAQSRAAAAAAVHRLRVEMLAGLAVLLVESRVFGEDLGRLRRGLRPRSGSRSRTWLSSGRSIGFTAFAYCLNELPATTVGTYAYVNPVVAVALGAAFLGEPLTSGILAGGALILVAVVLTTRRRRASEAKPPDEAPVLPKHLAVEGGDQVR